MTYWIALYCCLLFFSGSYCCMAQQGKRSSTYVPPSIINFQAERYRPKLGEFSYRSYYRYRVDADGNLSQNGQARVRNERLLKAKLGVPIILKEAFQIGLQIKHYEQRIFYDGASSELDQVYQNIEGTKFYNSGVRLVHQQQLRGDKKLTQVVGYELASNDWTLNDDAFKVFYTIGYAKVLNERVTLGGAVYLDYTFGVFRVYPVIDYTRKLSERWTLALTVPKKALMRYNIDNHTYLNAKVEAKSWRYRYKTDRYPEFGEKLSLRKLDILYTVGLEREIHDWLWSSLEMGVAQNAQHFIGDEEGRRRNAISSFDTGIQGFFKLGVFLVPPRSIYHKQ